MGIFESKETSKVLHIKGKPQELKLSEADKPEAEKDLFANIKCLLLIGRLIFLLPCDGLAWESHDKFVFRKNSISTIATLIIIGWCLVKDLVGLKFLLRTSHGGVVGYAHPAHYFLISSIITFFYLYYFLTTAKLKQIFITWDKLAIPYDLQVFSLRRVTYFALLPMILPFIINALFSIDGIHRLDGQVRQIPENLTRLEYTYENLMQHWNYTFPFSNVSTVLFLLDFVLGSLPRAYVLSMVIVFSYMLSSQFRDLLRKGEARVKSLSESASGTVAAGENDEIEIRFWIKLVKKHDILTDFVEELDSYLSPLIFVTYLTSLYLLCMQLLRSLSAATGMVGGGEGLTLGLSPFIYQTSFCVESFFLYFMSIAAAQVNDYAHKIGHVLRMCPLKYHVQEIARLEARVGFSSGPRIGFTGLGCFVITKPFLLTIANAVITLEIVLLQAQVSQPFFTPNE